jgi:hypothetical protein
MIIFILQLVHSWGWKLCNQWIGDNGAKSNVGAVEKRNLVCMKSEL